MEIVNLPKPENPHLIMMELAITISKLSKDPSTKIGCVLVSSDMRKIIPAYNGFPSSIPDRQDWWLNRDLTTEEFCKYDLVIHAEVNALANANCDVSGWSMYITARPCLACAREIVSRKISNVYFIDKIVSMNLNEDKVNKLFKISGINLINLSLEGK